MKENDNRQSRKIQLSGGSTYILSLPKTWIEEFKINVGDSVTVTKNSNNSISVFAEKNLETESKNGKLVITQKEDSDSINRKIIAAYLGGYRTINITAKGTKIKIDHIRSIKNLVRSVMVGTEIVESNSESITIQVLTRLPELTFEKALQRMYLMAENMINEAMESLENMNLEQADEVINMDDEVDRFSLYIRRNLVMAIENQNFLQDMGLRKITDCLGYRTAVSRVERIADHAALIAKRIKFIEGEIDPKILSKIKKISENTIIIFKESLVALQNNDFEKAELSFKMKNDVIDEEKKIMSSINDDMENITIIRFTLEDLRRIAEYSSDIAEVAIDDNIDRIL